MRDSTRARTRHSSDMAIGSKHGASDRAACARSEVNKPVAITDCLHSHQRTLYGPRTSEPDCEYADLDRVRRQNAYSLLDQQCSACYGPSRRRGGTQSITNTKSLTRLTSIRGLEGVRWVTISYDV